MTNDLEGWRGAIAANLPRIRSADRFSALDRLHAGKLAIVAGAGPSLALNAPLLKRRGDAVLLAAFTALRTLRENGVEPDYVVATDVCQHQRTEISKTTAVFSVTADPWLVGSWLGEAYFTVPEQILSQVRDLLTDCDGRVGVAPSLGTVVLSAALTAVYMGAPAIALIGMDLSLGPAHGGHWTPRGDVFALRTTVHYLTYLREALGLVRALGRSGVELIDATEGGILRWCDGIRSMRLADAIGMDLQVLRPGQRQRIQGAA